VVHGGVLPSPLTVVAGKPVVCSVMSRAFEPCTVLFVIWVPFGAADVGREIVKPGVVTAPASKFLGVGRASCISPSGHSARPRSAHHKRRCAETVIVSSRAPTFRSHSRLA